MKSSENKIEFQKQRIKQLNNKIDTINLKN